MGPHCRAQLSHTNFLDDILDEKKVPERVSWACSRIATPSSARGEPLKGTEGRYQQWERVRQEERSLDERVPFQHVIEQVELDKGQDSTMFNKELETGPSRREVRGSGDPHARDQ